MKLKPLFRTLEKSLSDPSNLRVFAGAASRVSALATYASPQAVLEALRPASPLTIDERDAILVPILAELRATKQALWQSLAVLAFEPMLVRIRARLGRPKATRFGRSQEDDLDQRVLLAFLEAASSLQIASYAARALRLAVWRAVFDDERGEREAFDPDEFDDDAYEADPFALTTRDKAAANEVVGILEAEGGAELRDMMVATRAHGEPLREYVARVYPDLGLAQRHTMERRLAASADRLEQKLREQASQSERRRFIECSRSTEQKRGRRSA